MRRGLAAAIAFLALAPLAVFTRGLLEEPASAPSAAPLGAGRLHLLSRVIGATGVLRAMVLDGLWLRTLRLQQQGDHFEAALLAKAIARLEPRIDAVWTFQARHLAYDIPPSFRPEERWPWVLEGIEILRDEALPLNPDSIPIHLELSFLHYHKIGLDLDDAGPLYRSRLAGLFEGKDSKELAARAGMDPSLLERLQGEVGAELDPRAAGSHALYWARRGLEVGKPGADPAGAAALARLSALARIQLYHAGRPVKALSGDLFAFVPDLRFARAADLAIEEALGIDGVDPAEAAENLRLERARRVLYLVVSGRLQEARGEHAAPPGAPAFENSVLEVAFGSAPASREAALGALASALEAAVLLELAGEENLARGFGDLAEMAGRRAAELGQAPSLRDARSAVESRLWSRWSERPAWAPLAARLRPPSGDIQELPDPDRLLFRLDLLDPAAHPGPREGARQGSPGDARP